MSFEKLARAMVAVATVLLVGLSPLAFTQEKKDDKKSGDKKAQTPQGTPVLWRDPGDVAARDLVAGPGGDELKPDLSSITYVRPETGGYSVKYRVKDGAGKTWIVKVGNEARPETAASRLVWALGYVTEINYMVACVKIPGAPEPAKKVDRCEGKGFADARFEARPDDVKRADIWSWDNNPFKGTKELKGLIVLMALVNNWDLKDDNNKIIAARGPDGQNELRYVISDLGATFGKTGNFITHSRNEPEKFAKTDFIKGVEGGRLRFAYSGKKGSLLENITVEDAKWIASLLARLTDRQIQDAFRVANFKPEEVQLLATELRSRIDELVKVTGVTPAAPVAAPAPTAPPTPEPSPTGTPEPTPTPEQPPATPAPTPSAPTPTPTPPAPGAAR